MTEYSFPTQTAIEEAFAQASRLDRTLVPNAPGYDNGDILSTPNVSYIVYNGKLYHEPAALPGTKEGGTIREAFLRFLQRRKIERLDQAIAARKLEIREHIVAAINSISAPRQRAALEEGLIRLDDQVCNDYRLNEDREHTSPWRSPRSGKISIVVTDQRYKTISRIPQRKDGSHDYARAATALLQVADARRAARQRELARRNNSAVITPELLDQVKPLQRSHLSPSSIKDAPISVRFMIERAMTADEVRRLAEALRASGLFE